MTEVGKIRQATFRSEMHSNYAPGIGHTLLIRPIKYKMSTQLFVFVVSTALATVLLMTVLVTCLILLSLQAWYNEKYHRQNRECLYF